MTFSVIEGDVVIRDSTGNAVAVILDGAVYRLGVDAKVTESVLPDGAATEATLAAIELAQADGSQRTQIVDPEGEVAQVTQSGNRPALSVEYPDLLRLVGRLSAQIEQVLLHLTVVTDERDPM